MDQKALCKQLETVDTALGFMVIVVASVLLSYHAATMQREQLCRLISGDNVGAAAVPPVFPIKIASSALIIGALGFFLWLAADTLRVAQQGDDCLAIHSAGANLLASLLVLAAALIRLWDLNEVARHHGTPPAEGDDLAI